MYYSNVATIGFLCVSCVFLIAHECVDSSMAKCVSPNNSQLLTIKVHKLLKYMLFFPICSKCGTCQ
jgi:hypothetical protein